jgi:hypothetical protein
VVAGDCGPPRGGYGFSRRAVRHKVMTRVKGPLGAAQGPV